jgi:hypothetical protein
MPMATPPLLSPSPSVVEVKHAEIATPFGRCRKLQGRAEVDGAGLESEGEMSRTRKTVNVRRRADEVVLPLPPSRPLILMDLCG